MGERLFHTLDPTTRAFRHEGAHYLVTDTVGFIRKLPHQLVEAFKATLEETVNADLILHVVDASAARGGARRDDGARSTRCSTRSARATSPRLLVLNKVDLLDRRRAAPARAVATATPCSSRRSRARASTSCASASRQPSATALEAVELLVPFERGAVLSELHELAGDLEREDTAAGRARAGTRAGRASRRGLRPFELNGRAPAARGRLNVEFQRLAPSEAPAAARPRGRCRLRPVRGRGRAPRPGERASVGTGIAVAIPEGHAGLVLPRSGLAARHGIALVERARA